MLKINDLHVSYGGIKALRGIDLEVPDGKIVTLIGANGAGKSTTLRTISGLVKAKGGSIQYDGDELIGKPITGIIETGIIHVPEGRRVFPDMTVLEKILYLSDAMEPTRDYPGVEKLRNLAFEDLDQAMVLGLRMSLDTVKKRGQKTHDRSAQALAWLISEEESKS